MPIRTFETALDTTPDKIFDWHARPGAFDRLAPPWQAIELESSAPLVEGSRARIVLRKGPFRFRWVAQHSDVEPGEEFTDSQISGPFSRWVHRHRFLEAEGKSLLRDEIDYELPAGPLGRLLAGSQVERDLSTTFAYRHRTTARDLARHERFAPQQPLRIAVTGASGLVGGALGPFLSTGGHEVIALRRPSSEAPEADWSPAAGLLSPARLEGVHALVHLAGENIAAGRWTEARKERIRRSRVEGTRNLVRSLAKLSQPPRTLVCASAIGYYGSSAFHSCDEEAPPGTGFLSELCRDWEEAASEARKLGMRVVNLRFGVVLTPAGGALARMLPPFRFGVGGRLGSGRQSMSWVSIDDAIGAIHHALLDDRLTGPANVVAPGAVTNAEFTKALARVLRRPAWFSAPSAAVRLALGEMAEELLLSGPTVVPAKLLGEGFDFLDPALEPTLRRLLGKAVFE